MPLTRAFWTLLLLIFPLSLRAQDWKEIYQDFRGGKVLGDEWKFIGTQSDKDGMNSDANGLRIVIPKARKTYQVVGIRLNFPLSGDFEITGKYEVLNVEKSPGGVPVGVAFNLVVANDHKKMAKLGRFMHPIEGDVHLAETWMPDGKRPVITRPAKGKIGQARMIRQGAKVTYHVADEDGKFEKIFENDFSDEDLEIVRMGANNNSAPAGVDVRIIEVRLRPLPRGPNAAPPPNAVESNVSEQRAVSRGWLVAIAIIGVLVLLMFAAATGVVLVLRQRKK